MSKLFNIFRRKRSPALFRKRNSGTIAHQFSRGGPGLKPLTRGIGKGLRVIKGV